LTPPRTRRADAERTAAAGSGSGSGSHTLGVDEIVAAALRVGMTKGFAALTMRALAEELGVSAMAAYHHVPNKEALVELVIDAVLAKVEVPAPEFGDWAERLRELQGRSELALQAWPGLDLLVLERSMTLQGWRLMDGYFQILLDGGFTRRNTVLAFSVMHAFGMGRVVLERQLVEQGQRGQDTRASRQPQDWPAVGSTSSVWRQLHRPDFRGFAQDVILDGLRVILAEQERQQQDDADSVTPVQLT
jgi:AcrR family transcriptional regulator